LQEVLEFVASEAATVLASAAAAARNCTARLI